MRFKAGHRKVGGRKPGAPNKATVEIKEFARSILADPVYQTKLKQRLRDGDAPQLEVLMYHYAYGKPTETIKHSGGATLEEIITASMELEGQDP